MRLFHRVYFWHSFLSCDHSITTWCISSARSIIIPTLISSIFYALYLWWFACYLSDAIPPSLLINGWYLSVSFIIRLYYSSSLWMNHQLITNIVIDVVCGRLVNTLSLHLSSRRRRTRCVLLFKLSHGCWRRLSSTVVHRSICWLNSSFGPVAFTGCTKSLCRLLDAFEGNRRLYSC